jgi:DNA-binding IclR family transcriptional regulator
MRNTGSVALVQSVDRAVTVLEILARRGQAGVTEIAAELGVHKSTASRIVSVLERRGLVDQPQKRGKYRLGMGVVRLANVATAQLELAQESRAACERLAADIGETVNVAVYDDGWAVNISQVRGPAAVASHNWVGQRTPLHATSSGKVLLAAQPDEVRDALLAGPLERYTDRTVVDPGPLRRELDRALVRGWASTREELEVGLNAVAAPVYGYGGGVVAAVSVSGPSYRLVARSFPAVAERVVASATAIGTRLGAIDGPG